MTQAGSRASQGEKAGSQPGQVGGVLLHETAVSGTNQKEAKNPKRTNLVFCTTDNTNSPPTVAESVTEIGGGHPSKGATRQLLERYDTGPSGWYPDKTDPIFVVSK